MKSMFGAMFLALLASAGTLVAPASAEVPPSVTISQVRVDATYYVNAMPDTVISVSGFAAGTDIQQAVERTYNGTTTSTQEYVKTVTDTTDGGTEELILDSSTLPIGDYNLEIGGCVDVDRDNCSVIFPRFSIANITTVKISHTKFSPRDRDGINDRVTFTYKITHAPRFAKIHISGPNGIVRRIDVKWTPRPGEGNGGDVETWTWNGRNGRGILVKPSLYKIEVFAAWETPDRARKSKFVQVLRT